MENKDVVAATTTTAGTRQACAACKHQRKKCSENCILSQYFPADKNADFQAAHKVFGVSNISKLLKSLRTSEERKSAIESLVWEAQCRQKDPVSGSYGLYKKACNELKLLEGQLQRHGVTNQIGPKTTTNNKKLVIGWNGNNLMVGGGGGFDYNNSTNNYIQNNGGFIEEPVHHQFGYSSLLQAEQENRYQGRDGVPIRAPNLLNQHEQYFYHPE